MDSSFKYVKLKCSCVLSVLIQTEYLTNGNLWKLTDAEQRLMLLMGTCRLARRYRTIPTLVKVVLNSLGQYFKNDMEGVRCQCTTSNQHSAGWQCFFKPLSYEIPKQTAGMHYARVIMWLIAQIITGSCTTDKKLQ
jgi:hypothetical protein